MLERFLILIALAAVGRATTLTNSGGAIDMQPFYQNTVDLSATATGAPPHHPTGFAGAASLVQTYVLTITGGTGQSDFIPCLFAGGIYLGSQAMASASFGTVSVSNVPFNAVRTCSQYPAGFNSTLVPATPIPFTFGVPQEFTIALSVSTPEGFGGAELYGIQDYVGNQWQDAQFTLQQVPEEPPLLAVVPLLALLWVLREVCGARRPALRL
ncbi:MAG TPA: hypothetical protein VFA04_13510 [Bryobacteraceae bacterium]|nr:hypothetical protein [Bryobacteraceae bacterium]